MDKILVVEDDERLAEHVGGLIRSVGFVPLLVLKQRELDTCLIERPQLQAIILDRLVDGLDTKNRLPELKAAWRGCPILILSAINTPLERAELLNLGADDYLGKPFLSQELLARVKALTRRFGGNQNNFREIGDVILDIPKRIIIHGEHHTQLPAKEFLLLKLLSEDMGRVLNKNEILDFVWNNSLDVETSVVESTMANLRKRLAQIGSNLQVRNKRNTGYWLEE